MSHPDAERIRAFLGQAEDAIAALDRLVADYEQAIEALHRCRSDFHAKVIALQAERVK